jgi:tellurite resistance protein TehA-like permease
MMPLLSELLPYIKGVTLLFWATATWWIPMLLTLGWWRHVMRRYPFGYDPLYWGGVFPLGMYAACTFRLEHVLQLESLKLIPYVFAYASLIAWIVTFTGMMRAIVHAKKSPVATV